MSPTPTTHPEPINPGYGTEVALERAEDNYCSLHLRIVVGAARMNQKWETKPLQNGIQSFARQPRGVLHLAATK